MMKTPSHLVHKRILLRKILDRMHVKMRLQPHNIWKDEAVVWVNAMYEKLRLVICKIEAGKNKRGLNGELLCSWTLVSFSEFLLKYFFNIFPIKKINMQVNSPSVRPQHWRNGCLNGLIFLFTVIIGIEVDLVLF